MSFFLFALWLLLVWSLGWLFFPVSRRIFGGVLPDDGLAVGRILALCGWTFAAFLAARGGVSVALCAWFYLPLLAVCLGFWWREKLAISEVIRSKRKAIVSTELLFLAVFLVGFGLRGFWSDTNGTNGEKGMDAMLVGALSRAQKLPPPNPYAANADLNSYYVFGHLETALLTNATGTTVRWSYNLMCATLPALCVSALFSLGAALTGRLWGGAFVCFAVLFLGPLSPLAQWSNPASASPGQFLNLNFFNVSRVIPFSINEFPFFTFNQGDLHAHYFSFQWQIAAMCLALTLALRPQKASVSAAIVVLGALICTNTWDFPAYFLACALALGLAPTTKSRKTVAIFALAVGALLLAAPFLLGLKSAAGKPKPLPLPASPLREWLLMWGVFVAAWALLFAHTVWANKPRRQMALLGAGSLLLVGAIASGWGYPPELIPAHQESALAAWKSPFNLAWLVWPTLLSCMAGAVWIVKSQTGTLRFLGVLAIAGLTSLIWAESTWAGFLGDANSPFLDDYKRQDTVFKFGLQTWFLWGTACAVGGFLTFSRWPYPFRAFVWPVFLVMSLGSIAVFNGRARGFTQFDAWDGWAHLAPPEKEAARWLETQVAPDQAILEGEPREGGDYSPFSRYAHATGIPILIGPPAHTFQWSPANSGTPEMEWKEVFDRKLAARAIYENPVERHELLQKYRIRYIVWGELERGSPKAPNYAPHTENSLVSDPKLRLAAQFGDAQNPRRVAIFEVASTP